ncbi:hypothetical protein EDB80DRAFT_375823 [Ilyonectria destructans]|nr:hypothetical protein EDB80DRAFT_375823 [Ilyonectria destructans]
MISSIPLQPLLHFTSFVDYIGLLHSEACHFGLGWLDWIHYCDIPPPMTGLTFFSLLWLGVYGPIWLRAWRSEFDKKRMESGTRFMGSTYGIVLPYLLSITPLCLLRHSSLLASGFMPQQSKPIPIFAYLSPQICSLNLLHLRACLSTPNLPWQAHYWSPLHFTIAACQPCNYPISRQHAKIQSNLKIGFSNL